MQETSGAISGAYEAGYLARLREAIQALEIGEVPLLSGAAPRLASLPVQTGCRLPGCSVLLAAADAGASAIATFGERLLRVAAARGFETAT